MDPLTSLHYYAPVCAAINLFILPFTEGLAPFRDLAALASGSLDSTSLTTGVGMGPLGVLALFVSNASVAFLLNVAAVFLVGVGSGLVLTLAGVFKVRRTSFGSLI